MASVARGGQANTFKSFELHVIDMIDEFLAVIPRE